MTDTSYMYEVSSTLVRDFAKAHEPRIAKEVGPEVAAQVVGRPWSERLPRVLDARFHFAAQRLGYAANVLSIDLQSRNKALMQELDGVADRLVDQAEGLLDQEAAGFVGKLATVDVLA